MRRLYWIVGAGAVAGGLAWWFFGDPEPAGVFGDVRQTFLDAINAITQGRRLTSCSYNKTTGVAPCSPQSLADSAGLDLETYALARVIASEEGNSSTATQALVAHAVKNHAAAAGKSIASVLLAAKNPAHSGYFGTQADLETTTSSGRHPSDRYASTATDPYEGHAAVAAGVLDGTIPDLTGGADQFDRPSGEANPDQVAANRVASGSELADVPDVGQGDDIRFWTKGIN